MGVNFRGRFTVGCTWQGGVSRWDYYPNHFIFPFFDFPSLFTLIRGEFLRQLVFLRGSVTYENNRANHFMSTKTGVICLFTYIEGSFFKFIFKALLLKNWARKEKTNMNEVARPTKTIPAKGRNLRQRLRNHAAIRSRCQTTPDYFKQSYLWRCIPNP